MKQFCVYTNQGAGRQIYPYLINIQHSVASALQHVLVVPLIDQSLLSGKPLSAKICPGVEISGRAYVAITPMMAGTKMKEIGEEVADVKQYQQPLRDAVDFLLNGY
ncbi:MAG TPA: taxon MazF [Pseudomonas sp.]|nr:taxon MazF [Pseudomonas sp.]